MCTCICICTGSLELSILLISPRANDRHMLLPHVVLLDLMKRNN